MIDWRHWHNEPYLIGGLVLLGWLWAILAGPLRSRLAPDAPYPRRERVWFYTSLLIFYLAVGSPLDQMGERFLFSAHMLQHQLLMYPAAMMMLLGIPAWMVDPVLERRSVLRIARIITHPILCTLIFSAVVGLWHLPALYDWALRDKVVHVVEHVMFFTVSLLYWWPIVSPSRALPPRNPGVQMIYLVGVVIAMTPAFAYITFSDEILYPTYEFAPRIWAALDAGNDQLLAGSMMKLVGLAVALATLGTVFYRWYEEKK